MAAKKAEKKPSNPLFEKRPKTFGVGGALPPKRDLHRFVKWPKYVRLQRQRRVLYQRLKVRSIPPSLLSPDAERSLLPPSPTLAPRGLLGLGRDEPP